MGQKLEVRPQAFVLKLAEAVALADLVVARRLAWNLPESATIEEHCQVGRLIGGCGRRIRYVLDGATDDGLDRIAPPFPEWPQLELMIGSVYVEAAKATYKVGLQGAALRSALNAARTTISATSHDETPAIDETATGGLNRLIALLSEGRHEPRWVRRGNPTKTYDGRWRIASRDAPLQRMAKIENRLGLAQKIHHTAFRESVATEVAALNLLELDCMPWRFYVDMCRQAEDESKHAMMCLVRMSELDIGLGAFELPYLGNFYEMFWEMTPAERLVAMNLDTEAHGQVYLAELAARVEKVGDTKSADLFAVLAFDERRHARFGATWLKFLFPSSLRQRQTIDAARNLVAIHMASAHAALTDEPIAAALDRWTREGNVFRYDRDSLEDHEKEISLTTARRGGRKRN